VIAGRNSGWCEFGRHSSVSEWVIAPSILVPWRWCVWSFRPSSPVRLPHLKCLFVCFPTKMLEIH
jgi:hypothetical protein